MHIFLCANKNDEKMMKIKIKKIFGVNLTDVNVTTKILLLYKGIK
jgi:hypothetical protein